jgi:STE24 endopeptidase
MGTDPPGSGSGPRLSTHQDTGAPAPTRDSADRTWDDPARARQARAFGNAARWWWVADLAITAVSLAALILTGAHATLRDALDPPAPGAPPRVAFAVHAAAITAALALGGALAGMPAAWFGGHRLLRAHGLGTQGARGWLRDYVVAAVLGTCLATAFVFIVAAACFPNPGRWWAWATLVGAAGTFMVAYVAPALIMPLFYTEKPLPAGEVRDALVDLAARAGTAIRSCVVIDQSRRSRAANAAVVGMGRTRRIVVTDTLLAGGYDTREVVAILAHELGHHVRHDVPWAVVIEGAILGACLFTAEVVRAAVAGPTGLDGPADLAGLPVVALAAGACLVATTPVRSGISRWREARADAFGVRLTGDAAAWVATLRRLAVQNLAEVDPHPVVEWATYSHPSIRRRLRAVEGVAGRG